MLDVPGRSSSAVGALDRLFGGLEPRDVVATTCRDLFPGRVALVSSFGADAIALLHMVASVDPSVPVFFIDTGKHFPQTLAYKAQVTEALGLTNVVDLRPDPADLTEADPAGTLHRAQPDACCVVRKVRPLTKALEGVDAWFTGRRRDQTFARQAMPVFEADGPRTKINPLASWSQEDVDVYTWRFELPRHSLVEDGYRSIGCAPCTQPAVAAEGARSGRWRGFEKTECGIHAEGARE